MKINVKLSTRQLALLGLVLDNGEDEGTYMDERFTKQERITYAAARNEIDRAYAKLVLKEKGN